MLTRDPIAERALLSRPTPCIATRRRRLIAGVLSMFLLVGLMSTSDAATFTVDSTADTVDAGNTTCASPCTLRQAITVANNTPGSDTIEFDIPGTGERLITATTPLPTITETLSINGYSQPGSAENTDPTASNAVIAIRVHGAAGLPASTRGFGICANNVIVSGLSVTGFPGVLIGFGSQANGTACSAGFTGGTVRGSFLGLTTDGMTSVSTNSGVSLNMNGITIGGNALGDRNVIAAQSTGIFAISVNPGPQILNNLIGTARDGVTVRGNNLGINFTATVNNAVVGTVSAPNLIAGNGEGINMGTSGNNNVWTGNRFRRNPGGMAIDLSGNNQADPNDLNDTDTGANGRQNFPVVLAATPSGTNLTIDGTLDVGNASGLVYEISAYLSDQCDESGHGEGEQFLGVVSRTLDTANEGFSMTVPFDGAPLGRRGITLLARHPTNGSSEFSACFKADPAAPLVVNTIDDVGDGICASHCSFRDALIHANTEPGVDSIHFAIPGAGPHVIQLTTTPPFITGPVLIDGYSQPGASANTHPTQSNAVIRIAIQGSTLSGFVFQFDAGGAGSELRGLAFGQFSQASAVLSLPASAIVAGNWFGLAPDGTTPAPSTGTQLLANQSNIRIGGPNPEDRNVFANHPSGFFMSVGGVAVSNLMVENNLFGLRPDGATAAPIATAASLAVTNNNPMTFRNNVFGCSGTHLSGIGTLIEGNSFGLAADGASDPIGTCNAGRIAAHANARFVDNDIVSRIANGKGIEVASSTTGVVLDHNRIHSVTSQEIDLNNDGPSANDALDADTGGNNTQNFPLVTDAIRTSDTVLTVAGSLHSLPNTSFRIQFFGDASIRRVVGNQTYAGARWSSPDDLVVTTNASGDATFSAHTVQFAGATRVGALSATATRLDGVGAPVETSELGPARTTHDPAIASFVVTNTQPSGEGSFLAAFLEADAHPDDGSSADVISFAIPGPGPHVITPVQTTLATSGRLLIDGDSQSGAIANTDPIGSNAVILIELRNTSLNLIGSPRTVIRGLSITATTLMTQPLLRIGSGSQLMGNFIGVHPDGVTSAAAVSAAAGAYIDCSAGCGQIGGPASADRNLIAAPTSGDLSAIRGGTSEASIIRNNLFGMQRNGATPLVTQGSTIANPLMTTPRALLLRSTGATGDTVQDNVFGGGLIGIRADTGNATITDNAIGGRNVGATQVQFRNASTGIWLVGGDGHVVRGNVIRHNGGDGIEVASATVGSSLINNLLMDNGGLGIDLGGNGVTSNDNLDGDTGANGLQNFPTITSATRNATGVALSGNLNSKPNTNYRIRLCAIGTADSSGFGECDQPLASPTFDVTTDNSGNALFTTDSVNVPTQFLSLAATASEVVSDREVTSEFSAIRTILRATTLAGSVDPQPSLIGQPFTVTATVTSLAGGSPPNGPVQVTTSPNIGSCTMASLVAGTGNCSIQPSTAGPVALTIQYLGNANTAPSGVVVNHTIARAGSAVSIVSDEPDPSTPGAAFTVAFAVASGFSTPTGQVTITASGGGQCTATLAAGQGFCVLTPQGTGTLTLTADYAGSNDHEPSQDTEPHSVGASVSTTTIQSISPSPSVFGQPITVVAQSTAPFGTPSGPITVSDGAGATCEIGGGSGSCQLVPTNVGNDISIRAEFSGNAGHTGSFGTSSHVVNRAEVTLVVATPFRADTGEGQPAQFAPMRVPVSIAAAAPGAGTPTGTIIVESVLGDELCVIVLPALFCDLVPLSTGATDFTASYTGDSRFNERLEEFDTTILPAPLFSDGFECEEGCP